MGQSRLRRREDIKRALRRLKPGAEMYLEDLAQLWGVSKARFVTVKRSIADFPDHIRMEAGAFVYDAKAALQAMFAWETRNDAVQNERAKRHKRLLGKGAGRPTKAETEQPMFSPTELLKYDQLAASTEAREIKQGNLVWRSDNAAVAAEVFSMVSASIGSLANACDPNGLWPAEVRAAVDAAGRAELLRLHTELKAFLTNDADTSRPSKR